MILHSYIRMLFLFTAVSTVSVMASTSAVSVGAAPSESLCVELYRASKTIMDKGRAYVLLANSGMVEPYRGKAVEKIKGDLFYAAGRLRAFMGPTFSGVNCAPAITALASGNFSNIITTNEVASLSGMGRTLVEHALRYDIALIIKSTQRSDTNFDDEAFLTENIMQRLWETILCAIELEGKWKALKELPESCDKGAMCQNFYDEHIVGRYNAACLALIFICRGASAGSHEAMLWKVVKQHHSLEEIDSVVTKGEIMKGEARHV